MAAGHATQLADGDARPEGGNGGRDLAFRRAVRHSRKVRLLKFVLPLGAILIAAGFGGYSYLSVPSALTFDASQATIENGKLVMANPRLNGFTRDSLPYSMTATRALQQMEQTSIVELEHIDAKLPVNKSVTAMIDADHGIYDRDNNTLDIASPITVKTTDGMTASLQSAYVEIGSGNLKTHDPVSINTGGFQIVADAMSVLEDGKVLLFENGVKMELKPDRLNGGGGIEKGASEHVED